MNEASTSGAPAIWILIMTFLGMLSASSSKTNITPNPRLAIHNKYVPMTQFTTPDQQFLFSSINTPKMALDPLQAEESIFEFFEVSGDYL